MLKIQRFVHNQTLFLKYFCIKIMRFAPLFFTLFVYLIFDGFLVQIWACNFDVLAAFGHLFGTLFSQMQRECFLVDFGIDFGSLLAPICPPWLPFGSPWLHFGSLWLLLGAVLAPLGSISVTQRPSCNVQRPTCNVQCPILNL